MRLSLALRGLTAGLTLAAGAAAQSQAAPTSQPMPDLPQPADREAPSEREPAADHEAPAEAAPPAAEAPPRRAHGPSASVAPPPVEVTVGPVVPEHDRVVERPGPPGREVVGRLEVGYRGVFVTNPGYNPFSTQDYFSGASFAVSRALVAESGFSFAAGLAWDFGSSGAMSRGDSAKLEVNRFMVPLEGRLHAGAFGYAFVRVAPGIAGERVEISEASAPSSLAKSQWLFAADASAGYAFPLVPVPPRLGRSARLWLVGDGGYSWVADQHVSLTSSPAPGSAPMVNTIDLGTLGLRGAFFRVSAAVSY